MMQTLPPRRMTPPAARTYSLAKMANPLPEAPRRRQAKVRAWALRPLSEPASGSSVTAVLTKLSLFLTAVIAALALLPASGEAAKLKYHNCDGKKYLLIKGAKDPAVKLLRIKMRKSRADGYAPRCLVAEATA